MDFLYSASEMKRNEKQCNQLQIQCVRKINSSKSNYSEYFMRGNFISLGREIKCALARAELNLNVEAFEIFDNEYTFLLLRASNFENNFCKDLYVYML